MVNALQGAVGSIKSIKDIGDSKSSRVNAMAAANSAWGTYKAGQGLADIANDPKAAASQDVSVSITYGEQKNVDQTKTQGTLASASQINAGNQVNIVATGAGKDSNINIIGSDLAGKGGTNLYADNEVNIKSAEQVHQERSENKSEGWNAGVAISYGQGGFAFGVTAGGNYGKGYGNGDEVTYRNSHVGDENSKTSIISGGVTTIAGGQVVGKSVHLDAAALNIESQQDTLKFEGEQQNIEGQITVGYGVSGSASYSQSKVNADYAAVREQSGIFAGDDGYQINVKGQTHLKGGLITSTKAAEDAGKNQFSSGSIVVEDIQNHANYDASGFGISGSASFNANLGLGEHAKAQSDSTNSNGQLLTGKDSIQANRSIGFGSDSGSDASVTYAGINTQHITITDAEAQKALTGQSIEDAKAAAYLTINTENKDQAAGFLENNFDKEAVQKEINLQVAVTKEFSANTQVVIADLDKAIENKKQAGQDTTNLENASRLLKVVSAGLAAPTDSVLGMAAAAASPEVAREIGQYFKENAELNKIDGGNRAEQASAAHILAHTVLGAAVAAAGGNDALTAGLTAGGAEAVVPVVSNWLYGTTNPEELTTEQKATISSIAGLAGAGVGGISGGNVSDVVAASQSAQNAVANNYLTKADWQKYKRILSTCDAKGGDIISCYKQAQKDLIETSKKRNEKLASACSVYGSLSECTKLQKEADNSIAITHNELQSIPNGPSKPIPMIIQNLDSKGVNIGSSAGLIAINELKKLDQLAANSNFIKDYKSNSKIRQEYKKVVESLVAVVQSEGRATNGFMFDRESPLSNIQALDNKIHIGEKGLVSVYPELYIVGSGLGSLSKAAISKLGIEKLAQQSLKNTTLLFGGKTYSAKSMSTLEAEIVAKSNADIIKKAAEEQLLKDILAYPSANQASKNAAMIGAYDPATGLYAIGNSTRGIKAENLHQNTVKYIESKLGVKIGEFTKLCGNKVGACAEVNAADKLIRQGVPPSRIQFTDAVVPRQVWSDKKILPKNLKETCNNCKASWPK